MTIKYRVGNDALTHQEMDDNFAQLANLIGDFNATGNITAYSDKRLKKDILEVSDPLSKISNIRGVTYTRVDTGEESVGVIAQEVEAIFPELVVEKKDGIKAVNYNGLIGLLIEAIKDQQKQIDKLKKE